MMFESGNEPSSKAIWQRVLTRYAPAIIPQRVEASGIRGGFSGATLWRVVTDQGDFALRRWPKPNLPRPRILGLHRLLGHLSQQGLSFVAVPVPCSGAATLPNIDGYDWQLEPWMPGAADYHVQPTPEKLRAAMIALAQWHLAAERFSPDEASKEWFYRQEAGRSPAVKERLQIVEQLKRSDFHGLDAILRIGPSSPLYERLREVRQLLDRGLSRVRAELLAVQELAVRLQPCLRDVWHDHMLFTGDAVTGLIDPSACRTDSVACDLSRLIGSLVGDDRDRWQFALAEYQRLRPLSTSEQILVTALDHSGVLLSGWTWLQWICLDRRPFPDVAGAESRLETILGRMRSLV